MRNPTGLYPSLKVDTAGTGVVSNEGATLLVATMARVGLIHDPGKIVGDLAIAVALGGDCLADIATMRAEPAVFGLVASDPTVSRLIDTLARDADKALAAIAAARAMARAGAWKLAGAHALDRGISGDHPVIVDVDATLVTAHSDKEKAAPTFKRGYGFHPLCAFVDHGAEGTGEPLSILLRPG